MAGMRVEASGPAGSPGKVMFYLGMLFVVLGVVFGGAGVVAALATGMLEMLFFSIVFLGMFGGIGGFFAKLGHDQLHASDAVLENGAAYLGKIYAYEADHSMTMNGQPCLALVVRYLVAGQIREARVNTGDIDAARYPRGATVCIKVDGAQAALVPGSVSDLRIEQEDDLMNPDFDPSGTLHSVGVSCPNCGAAIVVPVGMSRFCPYCNSKVSVSADGVLQG